MEVTQCRSIRYLMEVMYSKKVMDYEVQKGREAKKKRKIRFSNPEVALLTKVDDSFRNTAGECMLYNALMLSKDGPQLIRRIIANLEEDGRSGTEASKFIADKVRTIRKAVIKAKERAAYEAKLNKRR